MSGTLKKNLWEHVHLSWEPLRGMCEHCNGNFVSHIFPILVVIIRNHTLVHFLFASLQIRGHWLKFQLSQAVIKISIPFQAFAAAAFKRSLLSCGLVLNIWWLFLTDSACRLPQCIGCRSGDGGEAPARASALLPWYSLFLCLASFGNLRCSFFVFIWSSQSLVCENLFCCIFLYLVSSWIDFWSLNVNQLVLTPKSEFRSKSGV